MNWTFNQNIPQKWNTSVVVYTLNTTTEVRPLSKAPDPQLLCVSVCVCVCVRVRVCVCVCVCVLGWVKCRAQIQSMGQHTWPHVTSFPFLKSMVTVWFKISSSVNSRRNKLLERHVINYSPSCLSKPIRPLFIFGTQSKGVIWCFFIKIIILCVWCNRIFWHALMFKKHIIFQIHSQPCTLLGSQNGRP